ncbi:MAG: hypothetical protein EAZ85_04820 [Bacteroidetes bacterium]|nr:MAG: hypothetical protein EAZ85_04820 [Bacteroidota bacterium]TAG88256.1 MAG: hypothetical protein EAZ20_08970 [Bacteroidota bacterium]
MKKNIICLFSFLFFVHFINAQTKKEFQEKQKKLEQSVGTAISLEEKTKLLSKLKKIEEQEEAAKEKLKTKEVLKPSTNKKMSAKEKLFFDAKNNGWSIETQMLYDDAIKEADTMVFDSEASKNKYKIEVKNKFQKTK